MTTRITVFDPPRLFVDEMQRGPFAAFRHDHQFEEHDHVTTMRDVVQYRMPLGPFGAIADATFVARHMRKLLEERGRYLQDVASR